MFVIKKIFLVLAVLISSRTVFSMDTAIDYGEFFQLCKCGERAKAKEFFKQNPALSINYQNAHGETVLLHSFNQKNFRTVLFLLKNGANLQTKDNYGQSVFSKVVYEDFSSFFKQLLKNNSAKTINQLCKTIPFNRDKNYKIINSVDFSVESVVAKRVDVNRALDSESYTALHFSCLKNHIPIVIELLKLGASLDIKNEWDRTPYMFLGRPTKFVLREAFNNGSCVLAAVLINNVLEERVAENDNAVAEVAQLIKELYVKLVAIDVLTTSEACLWRHVCVKACKEAGIIDTDEDRGLLRILMLSQKKKTKLNIKLALINE